MKISCYRQNLLLKQEVERYYSQVKHWHIWPRSRTKDNFAKRIKDDIGISDYLEESWSW